MPKQQNISVLAIYLTGKCNFGCLFCFNGNGVPKTDMPVKDYMFLVDEIAKTNPTIQVCIVGGEPFLHPQAKEMLAYAVKKLGKRVSVTTNLSRFPTTVEETVKFLRGFDGMRIDLSIDEEHLRFDPKAPERLKAFFAALPKTKCVGGTIISTATTKKREGHSIPPSIKKLIPQKLLSGKPSRVEWRTDTLAPTAKRKQQFDYWRSAAKRETDGFPREIWNQMGISRLNLSAELLPKTTVDFLPNGKARIFTPNRTMLFPQLSLGNWLREPLQDILGKNLVAKREMLQEWFGFSNREQYERQLKGIKVRRAQKARLFARSRVTAIKKELAFRRALGRK